VISGFLITGIIVRELDQQRFSLVGFYNRRIRRIFPALIVVLCVSLALGWLWMLPAAYAQLSADVFCQCGVLLEYRVAAAVRLFRHRIRQKSRCCISDRWASRNSFICFGH
jgi:peptidoglycan/LPS O-acetylase OafA/YrhL